MLSQRTPALPDQPAAGVLPASIGRLIPVFWTVIFCVTLVLSTLALHTHQPEQLQGWRGAGLGAVLLAVIGLYMLVTWGWLYSDRPIPARFAWSSLLLLLLLLLLLVWMYGSTYAWICLALLYPVIGALPRRHWPLPLAGLLLILLASELPRDGGPIDLGALLNISVQALVTIGIALTVRALFLQREQLRAALAQLRQAHVALAESAAQQEELAVLRERARLARAMHDNIGHALVVMNVKLEAAQLLYARDASRGDAELEATRALIRATMGELRRALADLRAPMTAHDDLPAALRQLARETQARSGISVSCETAPDLPALPAEARETIWYVAREALANVERHAAATCAQLTLDYQAGGWRLSVVDDGTGFDDAALRRPEHYGVVGMRERMLELGGTLRIEPGPSGGTTVEACLPQREQP
jgi:signal transduction histidine kinase